MCATSKSSSVCRFTKNFLFGYSVGSSLNHVTKEEMTILSLYFNDKIREAKQIIWEGYFLFSTVRWNLRRVIDLFWTHKIVIVTAPARIHLLEGKFLWHECDAILFIIGLVLNQHSVFSLNEKGSWVTWNTFIYIAEMRYIEPFVVQIK